MKIPKSFKESNNKKDKELSKKFLEIINKYFFDIKKQIGIEIDEEFINRKNENKK